MCICRVLQILKVYLKKKNCFADNVILIKIKGHLSVLETSTLTMFINKVKYTFKKCT